MGDLWLAAIGLFFASLAFVISVLLRLPRAWVDRELRLDPPHHSEDAPERTVKVLSAARRRVSIGLDWIAAVSLVVAWIGFKVALNAVSGS